MKIGHICAKLRDNTPVGRSTYYMGFFRDGGEGRQITKKFPKRCEARDSKRLSLLIRIERLKFFKNNTSVCSHVKKIQKNITICSVEEKNTHWTSPSDLILRKIEKKNFLRRRYV